MDEITANVVVGRQSDISGYMIHTSVDFLLFPVGRKIPEA